MRPVLLIFPPDLSEAVPEPQEPLLEEEARRLGYDLVDFSLTVFARSDR